MASTTDKALRNQVMYSIYVRQFSREGTFRAVEPSLPRIRALGVDVIWLMPIHPIGVANRKGRLGSPYAISDYRAVNPELGTLEDFKHLVNAVHAQGMKCIIDVVYNHTSPDSHLAASHPEWFYHKADGSFGNQIGDWSDIIDLDYTNLALWEYQIDTLKQWAAIVDGFRCDVAPLIPLEFWRRARAEVETVRPGCLWLSESVEAEFTVANRSRGMVSLSDAEIEQVFDLSYEYDVYHDFIHCLLGEESLAEYADKLNRQEYTYSDRYVKLRFLENHDRPRAKFILPDDRQRRNWTAFLFFQKGMTLLYNGQECENVFRPSLFDKDEIHWDWAHDQSSFLQRLAQWKKNPLLRESAYRVMDAGNGILCAVHQNRQRQCTGLFSTKGCSALVRVNAPDGVYENQTGGEAVRVEGGLSYVDGEPAIFFTELEG
ncbi:MAG: alpha-amylase family glycosyl hydrolase [Eubacteriales bacterium]|nr:alpha-amylase family glycosyl hydrolase [Eubacteriales bacterium]